MADYDKRCCGSRDAIDPVMMRRREGRMIMGVYAVTGAASGMGKASAEALRAEGHTVIDIDLHDVDVVADLSSAEGRKKAVAEVLAVSGGALDGAVLAAGLGPVPEREKLIAEVNYFGVVDLLEGLQEALAAGDGAQVVVFSSNSTTTVPGVPQEIVDAYLAGDVDQVLGIAKATSDAAGPEAGAAFVYAGSKIAVTHWMRLNGTSEEWAGRGIRVNAIAPGAIMTPLLQGQLDDPELAKGIETFPVPVGGYGDPADIAAWVVFMLGAHVKFLCGSVIFVDGGTDAYFRPTDWPKAIPADQFPAYQQKVADFAERRAQH